ncbi:MAG: hypothetical protein WCO19_03165 [Candidatus Saccharibacteria bacterium]
MPITKNTKIKAKPKTPLAKGLQVKRKLNIKIVALVTIVIAAIGALLFIFSHADVNGCTQLTDTDKKTYSVCSIRHMRSTLDSVLDKSGATEIANLKASGFDQLGGWDFGNIFRAPDGPYKGAVPIYRVYNASSSLHDYVTDTQRNQKAADWKASSFVNEGIAFYAYETQIPGTVPLYRVTNKAGVYIWFTTDLADRNAQMANNNNLVPHASDALKYAGEVAFYVYPPLDCSKAENFYTAGCNDERTDLFTPPEVKKAAEDAAKAAAQAQINANATKTPEAKKAATVAVSVAKKAEQVATSTGQSAAAKVTPPSTGSTKSGTNNVQPLQNNPNSYCPGSFKDAADSKGMHNNKKLDKGCIMIWQTGAEVKADGIWGPKTQNRLDALAQVPETVDAPPTSPKSGGTTNNTVPTTNPLLGLAQVIADIQNGQYSKIEPLATTIIDMTIYKYSDTRFEFADKPKSNVIAACTIIFYTPSYNLDELWWTYPTNACRIGNGKTKTTAKQLKMSVTNVLDAYNELYYYFNRDGVVDNRTPKTSNRAQALSAQ